MTDPAQGDITRILAGAAGLSREEALERLVPLVYDELRVIARAAAFPAARSHVPNHRSRPRGVDEDGGRPQPAVERPCPLLSCRGGADAPDPHRPRTPVRPTWSSAGTLPDWTSRGPPGHWGFPSGPSNGSGPSCGRGCWPRSPAARTRTPRRRGAHGRSPCTGSGRSRGRGCHTWGRLGSAGLLPIQRSASGSSLRNTSPSSRQ